MLDYRALVEEVLHQGQNKPGRNGMTKEVFGKQLSFHLGHGFPIITGRKMFYKGVLGELAAFLAGPTHVDHFKEQGCHYWNKFADDDGSLRLAYGNAWRNFQGTDQLQNVIDSLKSEPYGRRHLISAWDPTGLDKLSLQCCHYAYQWCANTDGTLDMVWIQRSADIMLGLPSDMILAAAMNILMAQTIGRFPGKIVMQLGSVHIYDDHYDAVEEYLERPIHYLPSWQLDKSATILDFRPSMFKLIGYKHEGPINFKLKI